MAIGSAIQSRITSRPDTTGFRAALISTGSHAYATGTFFLNAANGFTQAQMR